MVFPFQPQRGMQPARPRQMSPNQRSGGTHNQSKGWQPLIAKGVNGVSKTLGNVQQVLDVVQSTTPIIQQYGPMVKNIPAMYRMLKAFKDVESSDSPNTSAATDTEETAIKPEPNNQKIFSTKKTNTNPDARPQRATNSGQSTPKLFI